MDFIGHIHRAVAFIKSLIQAFLDRDANLKAELKRCEIAAEEGYKIADENYVEIKKTLVEERQRISVANAEQNKVDRIKNTDLIQKQESEIDELEQSINVIGKNLDNLREGKKDFSIVVYGRTKAGKSTLMEILTRGNGESIGKGGQRTTRDVRNYYWNGLKITDVPGTCAHDGKNDEILAMEAAKSADLILFLITDDGPQADEAACLAQLKSLGKSVLGIINIKFSFHLKSDNFDSDFEYLQEKLSDHRSINDIIRQFKEYGETYNQDWSDIKFVATHLLAAYESHPFRGNNNKVYETSNFAKVEKFILKKVRNDGRFLRIKTFVDSVAVPMNNIILKIYEQSGQSLIESGIWLNKRIQLNKWRESFNERAKKKIEGLYDELLEQLKREIDNFVDNHYEDEKAGENWQRRFESLRFDDKYQNLLESLAIECERKRKELSDELTQELSYSFQRTTITDIQMDSTTPWGKYVGTLLTGGGSLLARYAVGAVFPPLGIALTVVGIFSFIFGDSRSKQIRQNKEKLRNAITKPSQEILDKIHRQSFDVFRNQILQKGVTEFYYLLAEYQFMLARLGDSQGNVARKLSEQFINLNKTFLNEAINYQGKQTLPNVEIIARVPGEMIMLVVQNANLNIQELSNLIGEKVVIKLPKETFLETLEMFLGCHCSMNEYPLALGAENGIAKSNVYNRCTHALISNENIDDLNFKLTQQVSGIPIIMG